MKLLFSQLIALFILSALHYHSIFPMNSIIYSTHILLLYQFPQFITLLIFIISLVSKCLKDSKKT